MAGRRENGILTKDQHIINTAAAKGPEAILNAATKELNDVAIKALDAAREALQMAVGVSATTAEELVNKSGAIKLEEARVKAAAAVVLNKVADVRAKAVKVDEEAKDIRAKDEVKADEWDAKAQKAEDDASLAEGKASAAKKDAEAAWAQAQSDARGRIELELVAANLKALPGELSTENSKLAKAKAKLVDKSIEAAEKVTDVSAAVDNVNGKISAVTSAIESVKKLLDLAKQVGLVTLTILGTAITDIELEVKAAELLVTQANTNVAGAVEAAKEEEKKIKAKEDLETAKTALDQESRMLKEVKGALLEEAGRSVGSVKEAQDKLTAVATAKAAVDSKAGDVLGKAKALADLVAKAPQGVDTTAYGTTTVISEAETAKLEASLIVAATELEQAIFESDTAIVVFKNEANKTAADEVTDVDNAKAAVGSKAVAVREKVGKLTSSIELARKAGLKDPIISPYDSKISDVNDKVLLDKKETNMYEALISLNNANKALKQANEKLAAEEVTKSVESVGDAEVQLTKVQEVQVKINSAAEAVTGAAEVYELAVKEAKVSGITVTDEQEQAATNSREAVAVYKKAAEDAMANKQEVVRGLEEKAQKAEALEAATRQVEEKIKDLNDKFAEAEQAVRNMQGDGGASDATIGNKPEALVAVEQAKEILKGFEQQKGASKEADVMLLLLDSIKLSQTTEGEFGKAMAAIEAAVTASNAASEPTQDPTAQNPTDPVPTPSPTQAPTTTPTPPTGAPGSLSITQDMTKKLQEASTYVDMHILSSSYDDSAISKMNETARKQLVDKMEGYTASLKDLSSNKKGAGILCFNPNSDAGAFCKNQAIPREKYKEAPVKAFVLKPSIVVKGAATTKALYDSKEVICNVIKDVSATAAELKLAITPDCGGHVDAGLCGQIIANSLLWDLASECHL